MYEMYIYLPYAALSKASCCYLLYYIFTFHFTVTKVLYNNIPHTLGNKFCYPLAQN